jgi:hypothetical protein
MRNLRIGIAASVDRSYHPQLDGKLQRRVRECAHADEQSTARARFSELWFTGARNDECDRLY